MGLGAIHTVHIDRARDLARTYREQLKDGKDPLTERDGVKLNAEIAAGLAKTVSEVADEYFEAKISRKSKSYIKQSTRLLKVYVHDTIGSMAVQLVDTKTI